MGGGCNQGCCPSCDRSGTAHPVKGSRDSSAAVCWEGCYGSSAASSSPRSWKKLELPDSQLQNIWVTLSAWIPGHILRRLLLEATGCFSALTL